MEKIEYQTLSNFEDQYWWYLGLRQLVFKSLNQYAPQAHASRLLDAGCGTGGLLSRCEEGASFGLDFSSDALQFCRGKNISRIAQASITDIPFKADSFHCAVSLDVLCNIKDGRKALGELFRVLKPKGILILNLPAYECLKSKHDRAVHIDHRYRRGALVRELKQAGFQIELATYRNTILFPLLGLKRFADKLFLGKENGMPSSDLTPLLSPVNQFLTGILSLENYFLPRIIFPFGLSVFCVARKP